MIITVFGATGRVGSRIVSMGLAQGHHVRAFGRNIESLIDKDIANDKFEAIKGYVFDADKVYEAVKGADAVLSVLGGATDGSDKSRSLGTKNIIAQMQKASVKRIISLSGMGILKSDEHEYLMNEPGYPSASLPVSQEHLQAYLYLKDSKLDWTMVCASDIFDADADGNYAINVEYPVTTDNEKISTGNIADFMLKELKESRYLQIRVAISNI